MSPPSTKRFLIHCRGRRETRTAVRLFVRAITGLVGGANHRVELLVADLQVASERDDLTRRSRALGPGRPAGTLSGLTEHRLLGHGNRVMNSGTYTQVCHGLDEPIAPRMAHGVQIVHVSSVRMLGGQIEGQPGESRSVAVGDAP